MSAPRKSLVQLAAPLVVSFTLRFLFQTIDLVYAGMLDEPKASIAAIGLWAPFFSAFLAIWVGLSAGFTATLSRAFGHRDEQRIRELKHGMRRILGVLIPTLTVLGASFWFVVPHLDLEPELATQFRIYAATLGIGMPLASFWSIYPDSIVKAHHDTRSTMIAGLWSTATNIVLNTVFVFVFDWGIFGIALATVLSRFSSLTYAVYRSNTLEHRRLRQDGWDRGARTAEPPAVPAILKLSLPGGLTFLLTAVESGFVNFWLERMPNSTDALASFELFNRALSLALMPVIGASVAVLPYVARNVAEGRTDEVARNLREAMLIGALIALAVTLPTGLLFRDELAGFFLDGSTSQATTVLVMLPVAALATLPFLLLRPVLEAVGRPRSGIALSVLRFTVLSLPAIYGGLWFAESSEIDPILGIASGLVCAMALASVIALRWCMPLARITR